MLNEHQYIIHDRSVNIPIKKNISTSTKLYYSMEDEYSLNQNFFDPSKRSPPNEFMIKLFMRINKHHLVNKDNNLVIE